MGFSRIRSLNEIKLPADLPTGAVIGLCEITNMVEGEGVLLQDHRDLLFSVTHGRHVANPQALGNLT